MRGDAQTLPSELNKRGGDTVWIAPNERHWHGATSTTLMSHTTTTIGATKFHEAVTEAEYAAANTTQRD